MNQSGDERYMPSLNKMRKSAKIQHQVDNRIRELEQQSEIAGSLLYDQLTMSQWVQGFCKNVLEEPDHNIREKMMQYMGELMEDAADVSWQGGQRSSCCVAV